ncbi:MAG: hypothetical protein M3401_12240 [Actinomycetota bacterium]|nr:hypothetical protein [Actinomycetota bacterium]
MASRTASAALLVALLLGGCAGDSDGLPAACLGEPATIDQALERAPAAVMLADGTRLSTCVSRARNDADLQTLGASLLTVADSLSSRAASDSDSVAALRLGYLRGAARRGVLNNRDLAANLGRRLEQTTELQHGSAASRAALERGLRAGEAGG